MNDNEIEADPEAFKEGFHVYGEVRCEMCGSVDLSDADDIDEAAEIWNQHVREEHQDGDREIRTDGGSTSHVVICWSCGYSSVARSEESAARRSTDHHHKGATIDIFSETDVQQIRAFERNQRGESA